MDAKAFIGYPVNFKNVCELYPPTVDDVVNNNLFPYYVQILTISQEDIWDSMIEKEDSSILEIKYDAKGQIIREHNYENPKDALTPFEYLMFLAYENKAQKEIIEKAFLFFTRQKVMIIPEDKLIIFTANLIQEGKKPKINEVKTLEEKDFFDFQNLIRELSGRKVEEPPVLDEDPRVARMKAKIRKRERIKSQQEKGGLSLVSLLVSISCMGLGINPLNIREVPYAALTMIMNTYREKENYEHTMNILASGMVSLKESKPKHWIK